MLKTIDEAPDELAQLVREFWPDQELDNAVSVSFLESGWSAFAENDTRNASAPCGARLYVRAGQWVTAEWSIGWFQINACNLPPEWKPVHLFNSRHNVGTAHAMWAERGWHPWFYSATQLGLI